MSDTTSERITVRCVCGLSLRIRAVYIGRPATCPKCRRKFTVPAVSDPPRSTVQEAPVLDVSGPPLIPDVSEPTPLTDSYPPPESAPYSMSSDDTDEWDNEGSGLNDLGRQERSSGVVERPGSPVSTRVCPSCGTSMPADAVLCVSCGYNAQTGRTVKVAKVRKSKLVKRAKTRAGRFSFGFALSGVGAVLGAGLWFTIAVITKYEVGWIAWGVGGLAGFGMVLGYRDGTEGAGLVAAGMSVFGIFLAKVMLFVFVVYVLFTGNTSDVGFQRMFVANRLVEQLLDEREIWEEDERKAQREATFEAAEERVAAMSDEAVRSKWLEYRKDEERDDAHADETGSKCARLASHRVGIRAEQMGLAHDDDSREDLYKEEYERAKAFSDLELADAMHQMDKWDEGDKWSDTEYVCNHLVYQKIDREIARRQDEGNDEWWEPSPEEWKLLHDASRAEVDAVPPQECADLSRKIETEEREDEKRLRLTRHAATLRIEAMGLAYADERRSDIWEEESKKYEGLSCKALDAAIAELDAWEKRGKWSDADYVRNHLIFHIVDQAVFERRSKSEEGGDGSWSVNSDGWVYLYEDAEAEVDAIPEADRVARLKEIETDRERGWDRWLQLSDPEETKEVAGEMVTLFFTSMFSVLDAIFLFLAVGTAYKIACGKSEEE